MITIFSTPRPFTDEFDLLQRNAINSWTQLKGNCQIILVNDEENTTEEIARSLGVEFIKEYHKNEFGTPLLDSVFEQVKSIAKYDVLAHINSDIILFPEFSEKLTDIYSRLDKREFLLLGRRWDLDVCEAVDYSIRDWSLKLKSTVYAKGKLHGPAGMDYWVFPRNSSITPPAFCVGRPGMDTWLVFNAKKQGIPVFDGTDAIMIVHQQHGYPKKRAHHFEIECKRNIELAGGYSNLLTLREADFIISDTGIFTPPPLKRRILAYLAKFSLWRRLLGTKRAIQRLIKGSSR